MNKSPGTIDSVDSLRRRIPTIVRAVNADPDLALRASANPLFALEELGYQLTDDLRRDADHRVRFEPDDAAKLSRLAAEIDTTAGERMDLHSATAVVRTLARLGLRVQVPTDVAAAPAQVARPTKVRKRPRASKSPTTTGADTEPMPASDDSRRLVPVLAELIGRHPVVEPLVAYLQLEAARPRLAPREVYDTLRNRKPDPDRPQISVRFTLQRSRDDG